MTLAVVASAGWALTVLVAGAAWVRPVSVQGRARPRMLSVGHSTSVSVASPSCPRWFASAADDADLSAPHDRWWWGALALIATMAVAGVVIGGPVFGVVVATGVMLGSWVALRSFRHRRVERLARAVPDSLDAIARSTRAGSSVVQSLAALAGPDASVADRVLASAATRVEHGESLPNALAGVATRYPVPALRLAIAALLVGTETGAAPARAVEGVAATLRDRAALEREAAAHATQARASVGVLVLAPLGFGFFAVAADPRVADFLFRSPLGIVCLIVGVGLDGLGWWWMTNIVRSAR